MMDILIVENDPDRIARFREALEEHNLYVTDTAVEAVALLKSRKFDAAYLGYDLGSTGLDAHHNTGGACADWLSRNDAHRPTVIFLHTTHPAGAMLMHDLLKDAMVAPFPTCIDDYYLQ